MAEKKETMKYILRDIDLTLWKKFKSKCAAKGISIKDRILELIEKDSK